jgi:acyl-CoA synthetase (AMP-forming)/AMP-acid ligase II
MKVSLLQEYADHRATSSPDAVALVSGVESITYAELASQSNQLARLLREAGCRKGDRVGLLLPKSIEAISSMLAVLKAGCIYVPMDTSSPSGRLQMILDSSGSRFLLADNSSAALLKRLVPETDSRSVQIGWLDS